MNTSVVRIEEISISNYKNVGKGIVNLGNSNNHKASILGLYGQNGSGKTALIDAIELLQLLFSGQRVPAKYSEAINIEAEFASFLFKLRIQSGDSIYHVEYQFELHKGQEETSSNMGDAENESSYRAEILNEVLSYSLSDPDGIIMRKSALIDTRDEEIFGPETKFNELVGKSKKQINELYANKMIARISSRSFVFYKDMLEIYQKNCKKSEYLKVLFRLREYGNKELFVINTQSIGLISLNILPLAIKYKEKNRETFGSIGINLNKPSPIPKQVVDLAEKVICNLNIVLSQIVPGLTIDIRDLGSMVLKDGNEGKLIQLVSKKNMKEIPFSLESEGIKKIVSVLQLLVAAFSSPTVTVAVDELDGGIFEYLLGELLRIISENGKGQLIFTSHNLRPLETIDKGFIAFTTTNSNDRYYRLKNVKTNNNLRDFYYRNIILGDQKEELYNQTDNYRIALAFREAGEGFGG